MQQQDDALYSRGKYRLDWDRRRDGTLRTPFLQIFWYDPAAGRERSKSTGTADIAQAEDELDALYLERERGQAVCPTCKRPYDGKQGHFLSTAIADYLVARETKPSIASIRSRLGHVSDFIAATEQSDIACEDIGEEFVDSFREWAIEVPIVEPVSGRVRERAAGTVEASVRQLAAVINFAFKRKDTLHPASFAPLPPSAVDNTPTFRADIEGLAAMFRYCLRPARKDGETDKQYRHRINQRGPLLRFLQISVATWCRPDAAHDFSTDPGARQWHPSLRVVSLNPAGRTQTRKYRPAVPVGDRFAKIADAAAKGYFVGVDSVRKAGEAMLDELRMPRDRETGLKLIRRSMATLGRKRLGEEHEIQWQRMLGHRKASTSDLYALFEPGMLGRALAATDEIIEEIEALCPGAFRPVTGAAPELRIIKGAASA